MVKAFITFGDGTVSRQTDPDTLRRALFDREAVLWMDLEAPSESELSILRDVFQFHPLAIEDSVTFTQRPKIEHYSAEHADASGTEYCYVVVHGPDLDTFRQKLRTKEIDMFVSPRYLVSVHDEKMKSVGEVLAKAEIDPKLLLGEGTDRLLHQILDRLTDHYQSILDYLEEELNRLEDEALDRPRPSILTDIAAKKRELLDFRRIIGPQREVVAMLARGEVSFVRESTRIYFRDVQDHLIRTVEMIELYRDLVLGARDIYLSSISNRLNQIMKTLTIITVIAMPLTVITGFFGMNFDAIPYIHEAWGFWAAVAVMAVAVTGLLFLFRRKGWI